MLQDPQGRNELSPEGPAFYMLAKVEFDFLYVEFDMLKVKFDY